jgi:hypothetical protein
MGGKFGMHSVQKPSLIITITARVGPTERGNSNVVGVGFLPASCKLCTQLASRISREPDECVEA